MPLVGTHFGTEYARLCRPEAIRGTPLNFCRLLGLRINSCKPFRS
jgi:hypothetical protein